MNAFAGDVNLGSISVAEGNGSYSSYDGCVYTAGGAQMLLCPAGKTSVTFSSGIQGISSGAFTGCNYLTSVTVPASASTIASDAFAGSAIRSVTIPSQVTAIGHSLHGLRMSYMVTVVLQRNHGQMKTIMYLKH